MPLNVFMTFLKPLFFCFFLIELSLFICAAKSSVLASVQRNRLQREIIYSPVSLGTIRRFNLMPMTFLNMFAST